MKLIAALAIAAVLAGCGGFASASGEPPEAVAAQFALGWKACSAPLTDDGGFDPADVAKSGWTLASRKVQRDAELQVLPVTDVPVLRAGEIESTEWTRQGQAAALNITRWDLADGRDMADRCEISGKLDTKASADVLAGKLSQMFGRPVDRKGETARGGDFLTPRFDTNPRAWYWQMPQHDVYLMIFEGTGARLEILAMPNRVALYEYPLEEPKRRIFVEGQKL